MAIATYKISIDSDILSEPQINSVLEYIYEYCAIGAFTDDFNPVLNNVFNIYLVAVDSGSDFFKFQVSQGWASPTEINTKDSEKYKKYIG